MKDVENMDIGGKKFMPNHREGQIRTAVWLFGLLLAIVSFLSLGRAQANTAIPPEVQNQAQSIEGRFQSVIAEECASRLCTPVGCEVTAFKTLDEKQASSLPGLDESDEVATDLQYKLSAMRCEFAYEPILSSDAVTSLRQRVADKVRTVGVALNVQGRKLSAANPLLKESKDAAAPPPATPPAESSFAKGFGEALPGLLLALAITAGLLALIWGFRRLGKPKPVAVETERPEVEVATESNEPTAFAIVNKKERILESLSANPQVTAAALEPIVAKGDVSEICRVLKQFGPAPLSYFAQKSEYRDLFAAVHKRYEEADEEQSNTELNDFFDKLERLLALAQLGRPESALQDDLAFVKDLAPDEFAQLVGELSEDELMAVLSFVPASLRAHYLQSRDGRFVEAYAKHLLSYPRLSEQLLRRLARQMREQYNAKHAEIRKVSRDQIAQIEQLLNALNGPQRSHLFASLRKENPVVFERLLSEVPLDQALAHAPESVLNDLFLTLTPDEAAAYLRAHPDRQAVVAKLKIPLARVINERMGPVLKRVGTPLDFQEDETPLTVQARERVSEILKDKSVKGEVNLRRINEAVLGSL